MKKYILDLKVVENIRLHPDYCLLKLTADATLPEIKPGQFVEVRMDDTPGAFLRRPISINYVNCDRNEIWLLIRIIGDGTRRMAAYRVGEALNLIMPLGKGFSMPEKQQARCLLIGGGVGTAPLLYMGEVLKQKGYTPEFLLGARSTADLMQLDHFRQYGKVYITTEDGSGGEKGFVTDHSVLRSNAYDNIYTCGPKPMMISVARYAVSAGTVCEVSLENAMACGIGACLCCVEQTKEGHVCVCTEGPVFNIKQLLWLN
ncbi:MAG: dihydroorotate dehydrogenase electron transfer subunit [Tannerella sp.]|jgi:dihydroorotate dehydrogenase electron transfer subunit|nr:dihydroorotate dehydrogenase electron transfer subunit [Tannerella sp.]